MFWRLNGYAEPIPDHESLRRFQMKDTGANANRLVSVFGSPDLATARPIGDRRTDLRAERTERTTRTLAVSRRRYGTSDVAIERA